MKVQYIIQRTLDRSICSGCDIQIGSQAHACPGGAQKEYDILVSIPYENKVDVIKAIRKITCFEMSLEDIQKFVYSAITSSVVWRKAVHKEEACRIATQLEKVGAVIDLY